MNPILTRIDYNGGQIWVDETPIHERFEGYAIDNEDNIRNGMSDLHTLSLSNRIVGQSNLKEPLPNIPYVEIEEDNEVEAEKRAKKYFTKETCGNHEYSEHSALCAQLAYVRGWNSASAKKYTDEDVVNFLKFLAKDHNHKYYTQKDAWDDFKQSLQPKVVSIEIETKNYCGVKNPCECYEKQVPCQVLVPEPVTYQKDGKTFLKVKSVQYE